MNEVRRGVVIVSVLVVLVVLGGCGSDSASPGDSTPSPGGAITTTTAVATSTTAAASTTTAAASTAATTPPTAAPVTTAAPTTPAIGQCATSDLALSTGPSDGAMGSVYTPLIFTNTGDVTCTLDGHPGVSFIDDAGNQIGPSVERSGGTTPTVALAPGEQAHATLQTHDAGFFDPCVPVAAHHMKVYPPDQTTAIIIAYDFNVCTGVIPEPQFFIDVVSPGTSA